MTLTIYVKIISFGAGYVKVNIYQIIFLNFIYS